MPITPVLGRTALLLALIASIPALAGHPSLFYDASQVGMLRARAQGSHRATYQPLLQGATHYLGTTISRSGVITWQDGRTYTLSDRRDIGNSLVVFAFVSQVSTDARYFELARRWLMAVTSWGSFDLDGARDLIQAHLLGGVAIAYDMLAPRLTASEASRVRTAISQNASALANASKGGIWWADEYLQNHNWVNHAALGLAALATRGELADTVTQPWLSLAVENARRVEAVVDPITDGTWHEGFPYLVYGLSWHLPFVSALRRLTGVDLGDLGVVRGLPGALAAMGLPGRPSRYLVTNGNFFGFHGDMGLLALRYAAARYRDGVAQAVADAWVRTEPASSFAPELNQRVFEFLFYDAGLPAVDLRARPLDWYGADLQVAVFRSGWDEGSLVFALKSGPFGGVNAWRWQTSGAAPPGSLNFAHNHADDNGFYLYGNRSWLAPEAPGYYIGHRDSPRPQANQTVFHNSLTIDGMGQLGEGIRWNGDLASSYGWYPGRRGGVPFFGSSEHFGYAIGDGSNLYPSSLGLTRWERHALFLDRRWIVLRDVVKARAAHSYAWSCHFMNGVTREGSWLHGIGENGQALGVAVVAPASFDVSFSQQRPIHVGKLNPTGSIHAAQVRPTAASPDVVFLTALIPTRESAWASRPNVTPLDPALPEAGLRIREGASSVALAVFNDSATQVRKVGDLTLAGLSAVIRYENGEPTRTLLVRGTSLADALRPLLHQSTPVRVLEADGLAADVLSLSGEALGQPRIYAPRATRVFWNGVDVSFSRDGDFVVVTATPRAGAPGGPSTSGPGGGSPPEGGGSPGSPAGGGPSTPGTSDGGMRALSCSSPGQLLMLGVGIALAQLFHRRRWRRALIRSIRGGDREAGSPTS